MYPCDREVLDKVLNCIQEDDCLRATYIWSANQSVCDQCEPCLYINERGQENCTMCLEAKLRLLSLYENIDDDFGNLLVSSARKLEKFQVTLT